MKTGYGHAKGFWLSAALPIVSDGLLMDFRYFGDMKIEEFVGEEVREAFAKYVINEEREIPSFM